MPEWATIEETRVLAEALASDQYIAVIENLTVVENNQKEYVGSDNDVEGVESEAEVQPNDLPYPGTAQQIGHLEQCAEACGIHRAIKEVHVAKIALMRGPTEAKKTAVRYKTGFQ